ncbi:2'-5' RNA ligase family protein [Larkinella soli]|uniref:2'-5' RNA ligase family protein n=1 Tax=Larkinella soli TaxID=1770527 RepID=UPI000FFBE4DC|nr:2'-5' RNA ligase family protein [Larkinella soli]
MKLYFVALLPDETIRSEVTAFKQTALERFGSGHALKSPPHITLVPPFRMEDPAWNGAETLQQAVSGLVPFPVTLRNFDHFGQRVIFVDVVMDEALAGCQRQVADGFARLAGIAPDSRPFHAHMTVAFKDLQRSVFRDAWQHFSGIPYERTFQADAVTLLRHDGSRWIIEAGTPLGSPA